MIYFDSQKQTKLQEAMVRKNCTKQKAEHLLKISVLASDLKSEDCLQATILRKADHKWMKIPRRQEHTGEDNS